MAKQGKTKGKPKKEMFYAVRVGKQVGIYKDWDSCRRQVEGYKGAQHKKFFKESDAIKYIHSSAEDEKNTEKSVERTIVKANTTESLEKSRTVLSTLFPEISPILKVCPSHIIAWTDGACKSNGLPQAAAGVGVYFGKEDIRNISERLDGRQTNQRAELTAAIRCIQSVLKHNSNDVHLEIRTDSNYVVQGMTDWIITWKKKNWSTQVLNKDLWEKLDDLTQKIQQVTWVHVSAHSGIPENDEADRLAVDGCTMEFKQNNSEL